MCTIKSGSNAFLGGTVRTFATLRVSAACVLLALCSGCVTHGALSNRAIDFNEAAANASDTQLLLNIVRASYRNPTHYTAVTQLRETRVTEGGLGVTPSIPFGTSAPWIYTAGPTASVKSNEQPSFDVVPLDNRSSAQGLLRPVDPQTFITYWRQGWPRSVLLFLFVDDITLNDAARITCGMKSNRIEQSCLQL